MKCRIEDSGVLVCDKCNIQCITEILLNYKPERRSKQLRENLVPKIKDMKLNHKAVILLAYALGYIDDAEFKFITGLESFNMDELRD